MNFSAISREREPRLEGVAPARAAVTSPARDPGSKETPHPLNGINEKHTPLSREEVAILAAEMEKTLEANNVKLKFNIIEENDTIQVEIVNGEGKTIRKIPSDDMIKLSKSLENLERGFLDTRF
ncbi:flagellar biosynthesis protein FlaG [Pseudodesulfovibrio sp. F-1]|uniref:Flagellar biosynthesis protein FlaG n=1 Tax=Pseudodesulfovibrio alkaliphilus TaxID=2661613 RepID=A0A7K1KQW5_9BACT|nr:flagellar protein FlaG [Pseudodesulfovibrio alkaliphilus]MUM78467.1 flagellar biosynthesis protein FlaG [Pseudodesulfovibrio alkaliphilus]